MTLKTEFQDLAVELIDEVFGTIGEISQSVTFMHPILSNIDVATDTMISSEQSFTCLGIVGPWEKDSTSSQTGDKTSSNGTEVKDNTLSLKVAYTNLEFLPTANLDTVSFSDSTVYLITYTKTDPAEAVLTCQLRRLKGPNYGLPFST